MGAALEVGLASRYFGNLSTFDAATLAFHP